MSDTSSLLDCPVFDAPADDSPGASRRRAALERLRALGLPTAEEEVWRYSRVGELELERYRLPAGTADPAVAPPDGASVLLVDGRLAAIDLPAGVERIDDDDEAIDLAEPDAFTLLADVHASERIRLAVPARRTVDDPLVVHRQTSGAGVLDAGIVTLDVGQDAEITVVEHVEGDGTDSLAVPLTVIAVGRAARVRHLVVQQLGGEVDQIARVSVDVGQEASYRYSTASLGGRWARTRVDCDLSGRGADGRLAALWFGEGDEMHDFRTFQRHAAPDATSQLVFKGVLADRARSVYTGTIRIERSGRGADATQTNQNIKLSDDAWAESVPNLEIENNDVRCAHASSVGPVDDDERFYLESRGVPPSVAERLIVSGFFEEVLATFPPGPDTDRVRSVVASRLAHHGSDA